MSDKQLEKALKAIIDVDPDGLNCLSSKCVKIARDVFARNRGEVQRTEPDGVFSGDASREMWDAINKAKTVTALRYALYGVCCKLQEFEAKIEALQGPDNG